MLPASMVFARGGVKLLLGRFTGLQIVLRHREVRGAEDVLARSALLCASASAIEPGSSSYSSFSFF